MNSAIAKLTTEESAVPIMRRIVKTPRTMFSSQ
jgi:hypothetical protein